MSQRREKRLRQLEARVGRLEKSSLPLVAYWKDRAFKAEHQALGVMDADYSPVTAPRRSFWQQIVDAFRK